MRTILRYVLLRVLPDRLVPLLFAWDAYQFIQRRHRHRDRRADARRHDEGSSSK